MKFLNNIDGASKIITDPNNRFVTDENKIILNKFTDNNGVLYYEDTPLNAKPTFTWATLANMMTWGNLIGM